MADRQMDRFQKNIKSCSHLCYPGSEFTDDLSQCPRVLMPVDAQVKGYSCNENNSPAICWSDSMWRIYQSRSV